ncbi:histidinol-phosphate transaminase [Thiohalobacter sp. IOR34]|uniref:histidinol-phosphate transaminase n=1 Tax=Thiohalobacter sp. IOR34 TaxID=3057176 RepID=UPI0025B20B47|nr:histidinol-phosphate transaminase [Thiohalobacter sp. IOR34]WJW76688.1 histidinol-phosphate transaminase [Thiohalobacter sp. IOR34]
MTGFLDRATPGVRGLHPYEPGKPLEELEREYGIRDAVKLASNENPLGPSPRVAPLLAEAMGELARYPDGNGFALKQALAGHHGVDTAQITLGNGSNDVLELVARVFLAPGREAVFSEHAFAVYPIVTQATGATARIAPARDYGHDLDAMAALIGGRTSVVFIANPNNPTGTWLGRQALLQFLEGVPPEVVVVLDEAYVEYVEAADYPDSLPWLARFPNLVITRTFSKAYGLAGLRVGYALSHPELAELFNRVRQPFNVNSLALAAAEVALGDQEHIRRALELNRSGMQFWETSCRRLGLDFIPSVGNFLCIDVGRSGPEVYQALLPEGVIVRPVANYGLPRHLRITIGLEDENRRAVAALERVLA